MPGHDPRVCFPILPRCDPLERRCRKLAAVLLFAPHGDPVPGGYVCQGCGDRLVAEYREKIQEEWTLKPVHVYDPVHCTAEGRP